MASTTLKDVSACRFYFTFSLSIQPVIFQHTVTGLKLGTSHINRTIAKLRDYVEKVLQVVSLVCLIMCFN